MRGSIRVVLPLSVIVTVILLSQGAIQNLHGFHSVTTLEGIKQLIPGGPFYSQEAIKMLGTNGGGTLNANSMHPLSNPSGFTNWLRIWCLLSIPLVAAHLCLRAHGRPPPAR